MASTRRPIPDGYVSIKQAAGILGCTAMTVYRMFERGQLQKLKDPRNRHNVLIKASEVRALASAEPVVV
ncbi:DNA binding domain-containing protein, excisionase family [Geodermatophilus amargosae]|uniref:DNA binding domain-containing protein, excisionase family n=1 Tax=Geodermatophilus amargosae TaxID=1296565 RepID=A0A1I7B0S3_9ACTN|nr:DNA binding domain-containing protein, excisionase family [Geodermatophilus amargosae]